MRRKTSSTTALLGAALVLALLVSAACYPPATPVPQPPASGSGSIQNITWQWINVSNRSTGETTWAPNPANYTIVFRDDGTLSGQADCNTFTGTYSQASGFSISLGAATMAACGDNSLDAQYLALLSAVAAGGPDGTGNLALETAGGEQRMVFANGGAAPQQ